MKFYDREAEIKALQDIERQSHQTSTFTVLMGRRRIGKTLLLQQALAQVERYVYLIVTRSGEGVLCEMFQRDIEKQSDIKILGHAHRVADLIEELFVAATKMPLTLVIDEFQEFEYVNPTVFGQLQHLWDQYHCRMHINMVVCGSVYSMMHRIFENNKEPLFGRMTHKIMLRPFRTEVLKQILADHKALYTPDDLLCLYMIWLIEIH